MYKVGFFSANLVHQKRLTANGNRDSPYKVSNILTNPVHRKPSHFCRPSASERRVGRILLCIYPYFVRTFAKKFFAMLPLTDLFTLFVSGGPVGMIIITILFIGLFFAAWKAPAWVKEIGLAALVVGVFWTLLGYLQMADFIQGYAEDISRNVLAGGIKVGLVPVLYGLIVFFVSLVLRVIHKPRI